MRWLASVLPGTIALVLMACVSNPTPHPGRNHADDSTPAVVNDSAGAGADTGNFGEAGVDATPEPSTDAVDPEDKGDAPDASDLDDADDADGAGDTDAAGAPSNGFPPTDREVVVREVLVRDLDGDGAADVLVTSVPRDESAWGVYVFFDAADADFTRYDLLLQTVPAPDGVLVADVHGDPHPELVVLGPRGDQGLVEVYTFDARIPSQPLRFQSGFVPAGGITPTSVAPVGIVAAYVDDDAVTDLVVFDRVNLSAFTTPAWTAESVRDGAWTPLESDEPWQAIQRAFVADHEEHAWLVVSQQYGQSRFFAISDDGLYANDVVVATGVTQDCTTMADLDGDGLSEIIGVGDGVLTAKSVVPPTSHAWVYPEAMPTAGNGIDDLVVVDVDGSGTLDFVMLEHLVGDGPDRLHVAPDVALVDASIRTAMWRETTLSEHDTYRLAVLDSPAGVVVWTFALGGESRCYGWDVGDGRLARCLSE